MPFQFQRIGRRMVEENLTVLLRKNADRIDRRRDPGRQVGVLDAIRDQLRRQVVVITAGVIRRPMQRQVAVGSCINRETRTEVFAGRARIVADTTRVGREPCGR